MCFSAGASFGAGAVLSVIGVASIRKAKSPSQLVFATIPILFAIQQITEGFLWLALTDPVYASMAPACTYLFIFIAQVIWPIWVPVSILILKKKEERKNMEKIMVGIGALVSLYLGYCLISYSVIGRIDGRHIAYDQDYPSALSNYSGLLYVIATISPPFFSQIKRMWYLGAAILISYIITTIFYENYVVSVWCFFASVISIAVLAVMHEINPPKEKLSISIV